MYGKHFSHSLLSVYALLTILLLPMLLVEAGAENPCNIFQDTKVRSCQQKQVDLFKVELGGVTLSTSEHLRLPTDQVHWACCLTGIAADRPDWASATFLLVTRSPDSDVEGDIEKCKHAIEADAKWKGDIDTIEASDKPPPELWGIVVGTVDAAQADNFKFCDTKFGPAVAGAQAIGKVWIVSVSAKDLNLR